MKVKYKCNKCGLSCTLGAMESIPENIRVTEMLELVEDSHKIHSPDCTPFSVNSVTIELIPEEDLIGSEYGYHCEACLERGVTTNLNYGDEVNVEGRILCKDSAAEEKP